MFLIPFVLVLTGVVWDLRSYMAHRTDLVREIHVVAEVISGDSETNIIEPVASAFTERFSGNSAGTIDVEVVGRGTDRGTGVDCLDPYDETAALADRWCRPLVLARWPDPATPQDGLWAEDCASTLLSCVSTLGGDNCTANGASRSLLPAEGAHFTGGMTVFRNETGATESDWPSRDFNDAEWWVVVDVCLEPGHGLFTGRLIHAGMQAVDFSELTVGLRAAWRSINPLSICQWCLP